MKTTAEFNYDGYTIPVVGIYNEPERGSRDRWGVPEEPDCDAWFEIISTHIGEKQFEDSEHLADFLGTTEERIDELIDEALFDAYEAELDAYHEAQAEAHYENLRSLQYYD